MKSNSELQKDVQDAIKYIHVNVSDNKVTLTGTVNSWYQKNIAETIVRNAHGVWTVDNLLAVEYALSLID